MALDQAAPGQASLDVSVDIPGYSDVRRIGAGGMAYVYLATQNSFKRKVAIKVLLPAYTADKEFADRFLREAQIVSSLSHPRIVPVYDFGQHNGMYYMAMEYLPGGDLSKQVQKGLAQDQVMQVTSDIASALHFAHGKGFIHRDVKPENVMFREDGSAVLTDFGIARKQNANTQMTRAGQTVGTPKYMSPQQLQGKAVDGRTDIYSLGIMFYEMLTKQCPYQDEDYMALALKHLQAPIPKLPSQFSKYQKLFERMVAKEPEKRFQSGQEIVAILQDIQSGKIDAASIDSGEAADLKKAVMAAADQKVLANSGGEVRSSTAPRQHMAVLQEVDPLLDSNWLKLVSGSFNKLPPKDRKFVYETVLQPKGIFLNPEKKTFEFKGRLTVQEAAASIVVNPELKAIAGKLMKAEQMIRGARDFNTISDTIEGGLGAVDRFDTQENLASQKEKLILRAAFLDDLVKIIKEANFDMPESRRLMTLDLIKSYILQVFLRHEMLGYRFRATPLDELQNDPDEFIRSVVAPEARTRQCDVIKVEGHVFLVGPVKDVTQNPYSIRRFLQEDVAMNGQVVYFNVVAFPVDKLADPKFQEGVRWMVSRIVTLERQLSPGIVDLFKVMEKNYKEQIAPGLLKPLTADGSDVEAAVTKRMAEYERKVSLMILGKIPQTMNTMVKTVDDMEYLFSNLRRLLVDMACDARDFAAQSAAMWSSKAEEMDLRMMSYLKLMDKRKNSVFVQGGGKKTDPTLDPALPLAEFRKIVSDHTEELEALNQEMRKVVMEFEKTKSGFQKFFQKLFGGDKNKVTPEQVQARINAAKSRCLVALIRTRKRYPVVTVYLEFEDIIPVDEQIRHYALPMGAQGIARLPILVTLPEQADSFNLDELVEILDEKNYS